MAQKDRRRRRKDDVIDAIVAMLTGAIEEGLLPEGSTVRKHVRLPHNPTKPYLSPDKWISTAADGEEMRRAYLLAYGFGGSMSAHKCGVEYVATIPKGGPCERCGYGETVSKKSEIVDGDEVKCGQGHHINVEPCRGLDGRARVLVTAYDCDSRCWEPLDSTNFLDEYCTRRGILPGERAVYIDIKYGRVKERQE